MTNQKSMIFSRILIHPSFPKCLLSIIYPTGVRGLPSQLTWVLGSHRRNLLPYQFPTNSPSAALLRLRAWVPLAFHRLVLRLKGRPLGSLYSGAVLVLRSR